MLFRSRESSPGRHVKPAFPPLPTPSPSAPSPAPDIAAMQRRIQELESEIAGVSLKQAPVQKPPVELSPLLLDPFSTQKEDTLTTSTRLGGTFHVHNDSTECGTGYEGGIPRSVTHKTRVFGQSHWINGIVLVSWVFSLCELVCRGLLYFYLGAGGGIMVYGGVDREGSPITSTDDFLVPRNFQTHRNPFPRRDIPCRRRHPALQIPCPNYQVPAHPRRPLSRTNPRSTTQRCR